jgi:hypothetical protein
MGVQPPSSNGHIRLSCRECLRLAVSSFQMVNNNGINVPKCLNLAQVPGHGPSGAPLLTPLVGLSIPARVSVWVATTLADELDDTKACVIQLHTHYPLLYRGKETNRQFHKGTVEMVLEAFPVMIRIPGDLS